MGRGKPEKLIDRKCIECKCDVFPTERVLTCAHCKHPFHNDCVSVDRKSYEKLKNQPNWVCSVACKKSLDESKAAPADKLPINPTNRDILVAIKEMQSSQSFMSDKYDELLAKVDNILGQFEIMEGRVDTLEKENANLKSQLNRQHIYKGNAIQKELNCNLVISGISNNEMNITEAIKKVSMTVDNNFNADDQIIKVERLFQQSAASDTNGQPRKVIDKIPVLVKFASENIKNDFVKEAKKNKCVFTALECGLAKDEDADVYKNSKIIIKDHISSVNMRLLKEAKKLKESGKVLFAWFQNSSVLIRKEENSKITKINSLDDIDKFKV